MRAYRNDSLLNIPPRSSHKYSTFQRAKPSHVTAQQLIETLSSLPPRQKSLLRINLPHKTHSLIYIQAATQAWSDVQ